MLNVGPLDARITRCNSITNLAFDFRTQFHVVMVAKVVLVALAVLLVSHIVFAGSLSPYLDEGN